ncbi:MAG: NADH-quinone oxidoreductase subunit J [Deltaproteobacteria bacterium]|nr:MAG: NADH-quinone oxidoreductase subunit J [Deltaproteobacteria bacterium]
MILQWIVFILSALFAIFSALMMITRKNPIHSALFLIGNFLSVAVLYILLGRQFIAIAQVMIYAGAIMMLIIFTIMLISVEELKKVSLLKFGAGSVIGLVMTVLLFGFLASSVAVRTLPGLKGGFPLERIQELGPFKVIGGLLMTKYLLPFELASVVLLIGIIGAVILAKKER